MATNNPNTYEKLQRKLFRQTVYRIWNMITTDRIEELSAKERKLAEIIMYHHEYSDRFENADILDGREYQDGVAFNPFFHLSIHQMVEDQLSSNMPIETVLFCDAMENKGLSRHEAIHYIMMILIHVIYASASTGRPFDSIRYKQLLTECRDIEPTEIDGIVEEYSLSKKYRRDLH